MSSLKVATKTEPRLTTWQNIT